MMTTDDPLASLIAAHMPDNLPGPVTGLAGQIAARHAGVVAVLAYGSCLRNKAPEDGLIDYYVLTDNLDGVSGSALSRHACRLVPPNVYYAEAKIGGTVYRAKYAVLPLGLFQKKVGTGTSNPYFWARFAQPSAIVFVHDEQARVRVLGTLATACRTALAAFRPLSAPGDAAANIWQRGLEHTYASELRSEAIDRAQQIVSADAAYYEAVSEAAGEVTANPLDWRSVQRTGKLLSVLRLVKAAFTFQGGADYIAWKITRHSGQPVEVRDWHRRHPILAALVMLPKLLKSGAVK